MHLIKDGVIMSKWKDWCTETYEYTVGSIENLDISISKKYIDKINENLKYDKSTYSSEYIEECLEYIYKVLDGNYEYIDFLENLGVWYPYKEAFIVCLKRLAEEVE